MKTSWKLVTARSLKLGSNEHVQFWDWFYYLGLSSTVSPRNPVCQPKQNRVDNNYLCNILTYVQAVNQEIGASGRRYHLDLWKGWIRCRYDARKKQVDVKQLYNQVPQTAWVSWSQLVGVSCCWSSSCSSRQWEPAPDRGLAAISDLRLSS